MKSMNINLHFTTDTLFLDGQKIHLYCTSTGHYSISLSLMDTESKSKIILHTNRGGEEVNRKRNEAAKLHKQLCHASKEKY